jgi:segregation and condensation protein B
MGNMHRLRKPLMVSYRPLSARPDNSPLPAIYRTVRSIVEVPPPTDPMTRDAKTSRLEAALFLADEPLTLKQLVDAAGLQGLEEALKLIRILQNMYEREPTAFQIEEIAGGYQLLTRPQYHTWLLRLRRTGHDLRLTPTMMETLAVVAYRQPISRAEVEKIRGTSVSEPLCILMERGLIRTAGREKSLGRPQLYATTKKFLQIMGFSSLSELPQAEIFSKKK